jgi:hypothetical protein
MKITICLFFGMCVCAVLLAQADPRRWTEDGIPLRRGYYLHPRGGWYNDDETTVAQNAAGQSLLVWTDMHTGSRDIYAQLYDGSGDALWAEGGITLIGGARYQDFPKAVAVDGGWIIAWRDFRYDTWCGGEENPPCGDIFAQKLDNSGNRLWPDNDWTGVSVDVSPNSGPGPLHLANDGAGGALLAWADNPAGIYAQHLSTNGLVLWPQRLLVVDSTYTFDATSDGGGNMLIAWLQDSPGDLMDVRATKLLADGSLPWGSDGIRVANNGSLEARISSDGADGCYVAWQAGNPVDLRAQHLNSDGQALWAQGGVFLCSAANLQDGLQISASVTAGTPDGLLAAWLDRRINPDVTEVFGQKLSTSGAPLWNANGIHISGDATPQGGHARVDVRTASDQDGGLLCDWVDYRDISWDTWSGDLYAARVLSNGTAAWTAEGVPVAELTHAQLPVSIHHISGGCWVPFFEGYNADAQSVRHQLLSLNDGSHLLADAGQSIVSGIGGLGLDARLRSLGGGRTGMVWTDTRRYQGGGALYYQIVEPDGSFALPMNGARLAQSTEYVRQENAALCADGAGGFFVAFEDLRTGTLLIRLSHVNANGNVVDSDSGKVIYAPPGQRDQGPVRITPDNAGGCFVAWSQYDANYYLDAYVMRMSSTLEPLWEAPYRLTETHADDIVQDAISADGSCIVIWSAGNYPDYALSSVRISATGTLEWSYDVSMSLDEQSGSMSTVSDGQGGYYCAWSELRTQDLDIYAQHVASGGSPLWTENGLPVCTQPNAQLKPRLIRASDGNLIITWSDFRNGATLPLYAHKLTPEGVALWQDQGLLITSADGGYEASAPVPDAEGGFFVAWTGYQSDAVFAQHIDSDGGVNDDPFWQADTGAQVSSNEMMLNVTDLVSDGAGGCIAAWSLAPEYYVADQEGRDLYVQRVNDFLESTNPVSPSLPRSYALYQNFPNPFNPVTTIAFDLPQSGNVTLRVFDLLGREVTTLVNGKVAAGTHAIDFDASALPSGLYIYRLTAGTFQQSRKLVLLR